MTTLSFIPATTPEQWQTIARLASEIWPEHYTPIIGPAQVAYMVEHFQNADAIGEQVARGIHYLLIDVEGQAIGYFAFDLQESAIFLSKLYLVRQQRGHGFARQAIEWLRQFARQNHAALIWLTVNRHNEVAIEFYQQVGFAIVGTLLTKIVTEIVTEIGGDFVMDDYRMEMTLPA